MALARPDISPDRRPDHGLEIDAAVSQVPSDCKISGIGTRRWLGTKIATAVAIATFAVIDAANNVPQSLVLRFARAARSA